MGTEKDGGLFMFNKIYLVFLTCLILCCPSLNAQENEPEFIGEAYIIDAQGSTRQLDKEIAAFARGISWKANSWNALSLEIEGGAAKTRISKDQSIKLVVKATDNNSDPLSIINIYRFKVKKEKRITVLGENNSGTLMKSRTNTKNQLYFIGKRYGTSSYLLTIDDIEPGEYGIVVTNPNNVDEKRTIISCFGVD